GLSRRTARSTAYAAALATATRTATRSRPRPSWSVVGTGTTRESTPTTTTAASAGASTRAARSSAAGTGRARHRPTSLAALSGLSCRGPPTSGASASTAPGCRGVRVTVGSRRRLALVERPRRVPGRATTTSCRRHPVAPTAADEKRVLASVRTDLYLGG